MDKLLIKFFQYCKIELNLSKNTISAYKTDLLHFLQYLSIQNINNVNEISTILIEDYCIELSKLQQKSTSINRKISSISHFMKFLIQEDEIIKNPTLKIQKPKNETTIPNFLTKNEIDKLINTCNEQNTNDGTRNACIIALLYAGGMRVSELVSLKLSDISFINENDINNKIRITGKGNKERIVPINNIAKDLLQKYLKIRKKMKNSDSQFLFQSIKSGNISRVFVGLMLKNLALMCNIDKNKVHPHAFRHSIALTLVNSGMDIRLVQEFLGHKDISTTAIYTQVNQKEIIELIEKFHPMGKS